nr:aspartyl protease family protein [Sphingobium scionense]
MILAAALPQGANPPGTDEQQSYSVEIKFPAKPDQAPAPVEIVDGHILFRAKLAGQDALVMIDNGAFPSVIDSSFVERLGREIEQRDGVITTVHRSVPKRVVRDVAFSVPGVVDINAGAIAVADLSHVLSAENRRIDAIFGADYLRSLALIFQGSKNSFRLGPGGGITLPPAFPVVPLIGNRPTVAVTIGAQTLNLVLDLGDNGMMSISRRVWDRIAPKNQMLTQTTVAGLDGQPFLVDRGVLPAVTLGRLRRENVAVRVVPDAPNQEADGRLGFGFLLNTDFVLDIKAGKLVVVPYLRSAPAR